MLTIDGSMGEGGGQVLRTALGLSMVSGVPFRIENIRAGRRKPGLMRQHLTAVKAATRIGSTRVDGARIGSTQLTFEPGPVRAGDYRFAVGTAGSTMLVLQCILPALLIADGPSTVVIEGGTHNPMSPPFDFLARTFLPILRRMGGDVDLELERPGFYPAGGGAVRVTVRPAALSSIELMERGEPTGRRGLARLADLPDVIARRELAVLAKKLGMTDDELHIEHVSDSVGPGNVLTLDLGFEHVTEVLTGFGELQKTSERVAYEVTDAAKDYLGSDAPVGRHLADQLMIPMAMAGGGRFRALPLTRHSTTNAHVIEMFLPVNFHREKVDGSTVVSVSRR